LGEQDIIVPETSAMSDNLHHEALTILEGARRARSEPDASERAVLKAVALAPDALDVRIGAYKFYFYNNRLPEAIPHADHVVKLSAIAIGLDPDWRKLRPEDATFSELEKGPRRLLQSLIALSYCRARIGEADLALEGLTKAAEIDPTDLFGARRLCAVIRRGGIEVIED